MSKERKRACIKALLYLVSMCLFVSPFLLTAAGLGSAALADAEDGRFYISSGNYGWHVYGDKTGDPEELASVNITMYFKNGDLSTLAPFFIVDQNNQIHPITPADYVINASRRYVMLRAKYLATLPLGVYHIDFSTPSGTDTGYFYIIKERTIIFVQQPQTVTIESGENATFSVVVTGSSGYAYEWQRRSRTGWKTVKGATSRTMTLRKVPAYMTGYHYRCLVHSKAGDAYSDSARVFISNAPATGDSNSLWLYGACASLSMLGMAGCVVTTRRKRSHHGQE